MLLNAGVRNGGGPGRFRGGVTAAALERGRWNQPGNLRNFATGATSASKSGFPVGYLPPGSWSMPQKAGGLGSYLGATGVGAFTGAGSMGVNGSAALTGIGQIDSAVGQLVVSAIANLTGSGQIDNAAAVAFLNAVANLAGTGNVTSALTALGCVLGDLAGTGSLALTPYALGELAADITPFTELSPQSLSSAVWASTEGTFLYALAHNKVITDPTAGTMTVYDTDGMTVLYVAGLFQDAAGTTQYAGAGAERRDAFA